MLLAGCDKKPPAKDSQAARKLAPLAAKPKPKPRILNDTHTHIGWHAYPLYIRLMDRIGIHRIVNLSGGATPQRRMQNLAAADMFPGRIALFFNVDWRGVDDPDFGEKMAGALQTAVEHGFAGLKIYKALGLGVKAADGDLLKVDDPRLDPLWSKAGALGIPVAIHTGDPKAFFEPPGPENERYAELSVAPSWSFYGPQFPSRSELLSERDHMVEKHPSTTFILVHLANNPEDIEYVDNLLATHPNVVVDIAARIAEFGRHPAARMRKFFLKYQDRVLFGTDFQMRIVRTRAGPRPHIGLGSVSRTPPTVDDVPHFYKQHFNYFERTGAPIDHPIPIQGDWKVNPIGLPRKVLEKIYWRNSERIIFAPWLGRRHAFDVAARAASIAEAH